ncbi:hypothetical protein [Flagellimonas myxillae]|uniref:hypothetical protein n=1 Tax=Flagellimonas myxillae TaxID=2942214 RepID=UPI00201F9243|nr:hypothetical protein [Muricauda myxillae]MCL6266582.1 hypothetical protein [Muricauda myxillae]
MTEKSKKQDIKKGCIYLIAIVFGVSIFFYFTCDGEPEKPLTKEEQHQQNIQKLFSAWDGSHIKLTEYIKQSLNDSESYKHLETSYIDRDSFLIVTTKFTAKNGFGGTVRNEVVIACDTLGNIIEVLKDME